MSAIHVRPQKSRRRWDRFAQISLLLSILTVTDIGLGQSWPDLPDRNGTVLLPAQEWPHRPGPREIKVLVHYPQGELGRVTESTGLMLTLHNWGGVDCVGTAAPQALADKWNVITLCVNYLQSGPDDSIKGPEPYDFGYLQGLDALRALWWLQDQLKSAQLPYDDSRIYSTGGSGGGNVTLMANKLAPRTFTCVIDLCGMKKLSNDIAFHLPGGSELNARWSASSDNPYYLSPGEQELRFVGCPEHLWTMRRLGTTAKVIVVHGVDDDVCPFADAEELVGSLRGAELDVESHFISKTDLDGTAFTSSGHSLGNRTEIVFRVGDKYINPKGTDFLKRTTPTDFDTRGEVRYRTSDGEFVISYREGFPVGRFEPKAIPVTYPDHLHLTTFKQNSGESAPIKSPADWDARRRQIQSQFELAAGPLPGPQFRVPLDVQTHETVQVGDVTRIKISYQSDPFDRVPAFLFLPSKIVPGGTPAMLCLHQTFRGGKKEPGGLDGDPRLYYALELARRGYVTLAPDYPSFGDHQYEFGEKSPYAGGTMKAIWDNIRAVDLLENRMEVDRNRIGVIGHSLGGHNSIFTTLFEPRLKVVVTSCGFCRFHKDDVPSWTGRTYMPWIASKFGNDPDRVPFDFPELIAAIAPRACFVSAAEKDDDFDANGVRETIAFARPIFELHKGADRLVAIYPPTVHAFPDDARKTAYEFIDRILHHVPTTSDVPSTLK